MTENRLLFAISVASLADGTRSDLLGMASVLNRRGVEVIEAELGRPAHGRRVFSAMFRATPQQATTVLKTFENVIDVIDASLFKALDSRADHAPDVNRRLRSVAGQH